MCIAKLVITGHNRIINHQRSMIGDFAFHTNLGWSGSAMVLGKLPVTGRPTILMIVGQGPAALAVSAGGVVLTFLLSSILSSLPPSLWETDRYRLNYCLKGPLNSKQPTNQIHTNLCNSGESNAVIRLQQKYPYLAELFAYIFAYIPLSDIYIRLLFENVRAN